MELLIGKGAVKPVLALMPTVVQTFGTNDSGRIEFLVELCRQAAIQECAVVYIDADRDIATKEKIFSSVRSVGGVHQFYVKGFDGLPYVDPQNVINDSGILYYGIGPLDKSAPCPHDVRRFFGGLLRAIVTRRFPKKMDSILIVLNGIQTNFELPNELHTLIEMAASMNVTLVFSEPAGNFVDAYVSENAMCRIFQKSVDAATLKLFSRTVEPYLPFSRYSSSNDLNDLEVGEALVSVRDGQNWKAGRVNLALGYA